MLKREEFKKYPLIYIIGHKHIDADSVISSYILSGILKSFGINSEYAILDKNYEIVADDCNLIKDHLNYEPVVLKQSDIETSFFILVDHNNPIQSIGSRGTVLAAVDHHFMNNDMSNCLIGEYASTASLIYATYKNTYHFSNYEKTLIILAILSDTSYLRTSRYKEKDAKMLLELNRELHLDFDELRKKYFITNDFNQGIEYNFYSNYKKYKFDEIEFECSYVRANNIDNKYLDEYLTRLQKEKNDWLFIWFDYDESKTYAFFKNKEGINKISYDFIASRANDIIKDVINL